MAYTEYLWDPLEDKIIAEAGNDGVILAEYTAEPSVYGDLICQNRADSGCSFYHFDGKGSTLALSNQGANVTDTYSFTAFGEEAEHSGTTVNSFGYLGGQGVYADPETMDVSIRARMYRPTLARWLSRDNMQSVSPQRRTTGYVAAITPTRDPFQSVPRGGLGGVVMSPSPSRESEVPGFGCCRGVGPGPIEDFDCLIDLIVTPCNTLDWSSDHCPACKCTSTQFGERATESSCERLLRQLKRAFAAHGQFELGKFYCDTNCGGLPGYGLTCWRPVTGGKVQVGVCIPYGVSYCDVLSLADHEMQHVADISALARRGGNLLDLLNRVDRTEFERSAYSRQCETRAFQECTPDADLVATVDRCIERYMPLSTGNENVGRITNACEDFKW